MFKKIFVIGAFLLTLSLQATAAGVPAVTVELARSLSRETAFLEKLGVSASGKNAQQLADAINLKLNQMSAQNALAAVEKIGNSDLKVAVRKAVSDTKAGDASTVIGGSSVNNGGSSIAGGSSILKNTASAAKELRGISGAEEFIQTLEAGGSSIGTDIAGAGLAKCAKEKSLDTAHWQNLFAVTKELKNGGLPKTKCEARGRILSGIVKVFKDAKAAAKFRLSGLTDLNNCGIYNESAVGASACAR